MVDLSETRRQMQERLKALEDEAAVLRQQLTLLDQALALEGDKPRSVVLSGQPRPKNPARGEVADVVLAAVEKARRPLSRQEALAAVQEAGLTINGKDPVEVVATMLWRERGRVAKLKEGYWPAGKKPPKD